MNFSVLDLVERAFSRWFFFCGIRRLESLTRNRLGGSFIVALGNRGS